MDFDFKHKLLIVYTTKFCMIIISIDLSKTTIIIIECFNFVLDSYGMLTLF